VASLMVNIYLPISRDDPLLSFSWQESSQPNLPRTVVYEMPERRLVRVERLEHIAESKEIQFEYIAWIDSMLKCKHGIRLTANSINQLMDEIITDWPLYSGRHGRFILAYIGKSVGGMAGIKYVSRDVCELKRLYVSPRHRRAGLGRSLVERLLLGARILGYSKVRLETLDFMEAAIRLYESLGFVRTPEFEGTEGRGYGIQDHEIYYSIDL
jgi:GNAT superfamily N-acetyltransferase